MKGVIIILLVYVAGNMKVIAQGDANSEKRNIQEANFKTCLESQFSISLDKNTRLTDEQMYCAGGCKLKALEIIDTNGKFDQQKLMSEIKSVNPDHESIDLTECSAIAMEDGDLKKHYCNVGKCLATKFATSVKANA